MDYSDVAREVTYLLATRQSVPVTGWTWQPGVVLFPEARCPFCQEVIRSKAIWIVRNNYLLGQGVPVHGEKFVLDPPRHPHATPSAVCMGNATEALQALFHGLNPESVYVDMYNWLEGPYWEHSCRQLERSRNGEPLEDDDRFLCDVCNRWFNDDDSNRYGNQTLCANCFSNVAFYCGACGEATDHDDGQLGSDDDNYCRTCWEERFFECAKCEQPRRLDLVAYTNPDDGDRYCNVCALYCADCNTAIDPEYFSTCIPCSKNVCDECYDETHEAHEATQVQS